jgi:hypothetical protein
MCGKDFCAFKQLRDTIMGRIMMRRYCTLFSVAASLLSASRVLWCEPVQAENALAEQQLPQVAAVQKQQDSPPRAAIFIQNNAGADLNESIAPFRDLLSAKLTDKGFSILDAHDVAARFEEYKGEDEGVTGLVSEAAKLAKFEKTEASVEQVMLGASALRIAQMLDADYLIVATLTSIGEERKVFNGSGSLYKGNNEVVIRTLRSSIRVLEGNQGASVYGDTVAVQKKLGGVDRLAIVSSDANNELIDDAAAQIAENISKKLQKIKDTKVADPALVEFALTSNVEGATVELDGAVLGTVPGTFSVRPGLHQIAVSKEWYATWRRTINVVPNQVINVALERSKEGEARREESLRVEREDELAREKGKAEVAIAKEQSEADAYAKKKVADGESEFRKNSHTKIEGPVEHLEIESRPDTLVKVEKE